MNNENTFVWCGKKCRHGKYSPVLYCDNVAVIGKKVIDNRNYSINRGHKQQTELRFDSIDSKHYWKRHAERNVSVLDTIVAMQYGISFRSDVRKGRRWSKRTVYLLNDIFVCATTHHKDRDLITCYRTDPTRKSYFDWVVSLGQEQRNALRNCKFAASGL